MQNTGITVPPTPDPNQVLSNWGIIILIIASIVAIILWVYKIGFPEIEKGQTIKPQIGVTVLVLLAIFGPEAIRISADSMGSPEIVLTTMWITVINIVLAGDGFNLSFFFVAIPLTTLRLVFPVMVYRYYRGMTSRKSVIVTGLLVELPMLLFGIPLLLLLIVGLIMLGLLPVPRGTTRWPDSEGSEQGEPDNTSNNNDDSEPAEMCS